MASLWELRQSRNWSKLFATLLGDKALQHPDAVAHLRQHVIGDDCLLLAAAIDLHAQKRLEEYAQLLESYPATGTLRGMLGVAADSYEARRRLLLAATGDSDENERWTALDGVVKVVTRNWNPGSDANLDQELHPSLLSCLPSGWRKLWNELAEQYGWRHPGVLLAGETLATLFGDRRQVEATVETWVMFAFDHHERPEGVLARLTVERLSNGAGFLVPDARSAMHLQLNSAFSAGLDRARQAVEIRRPVTRNYDWRWRLHLENATRNLPGPPLVIPLSGSSGELAFGCALRALDRDTGRPTDEFDRLDSHVAATASFQDKISSPNPALHPVTAVGIKTLAGRFIERRMQEVVLAEGHKPDDLPPKNNQFRFTHVGTFDDAYHLLTRWPRLTRIVKQRLHAEAEATLARLCGPKPADPVTDGEPYVMSPLAEWLPVDVRAVPDAEPEKNRERPLSAEELAAFSRGEWRSPEGKPRTTIDGDPLGERIGLFADSGLGKSTLLVAIARNIAGGDDNRVPVLLGKVEKNSWNLSEIDWQSQPCEKLRDLCLSQHIPDKFRTEASLWFLDLCRSGKVVYLFDALDQSRTSLEGMAGFLNGDDARRCTAIVTGRPESRIGRGEVFEGLPHEDWRTLKVLPFGREEQTRFLGMVLSAVLLPEREKLNIWFSDPEEVLRHYWKGLLGVPLLLRFLKDLARGNGTGSDTAQSLNDVTNRYNVYEMAVKHLLEKGLATVGDVAEREELEATALENLQTIAWEIVQRHDFSGILDGKSYRDIVKQLGTEYMQQLYQADLVTKHGILDRLTARGLEFRHRSFLEYFAGCRLSKLFGDPSTRAEAERVLRGMQSVDPFEETHPDDFFDKGQLRCRNLPAEWSWTLRFALCAAERGSVRDELAWKLMCLGNPWVVYDSIQGDRLELSEDVATVCRWLVHRDRGVGDWAVVTIYRGAWKEEDSPPVAAWVSAARCIGNGSTPAERVTATLNDLLLNRWTRDGAYLHPLWELLEATVEQSLADEILQPLGTACAAARQEYLSEVDGLRSPGSVLSTYESRFIPIPAGTIDSYSYDGQHSPSRLRQAGVTGPIVIESGWHLSDFPVTNAELETWCPTHRRNRDRYSDQDDEPAVWVNWFMGVEFARWLTGKCGGRRYELPEEWLWESACRWGTKTEYWWGDGMRNDLCCYSETSNGGPRGRAAAIAAYAAAELWHPSRDDTRCQVLTSSPGLLDLHGNVMEWTASPCGPKGSHMSVCGGSWDAHADGVHSAPGSICNNPEIRDVHNGLRLCWRSQTSFTEVTSSS